MPVTTSFASSTRSVGLATSARRGSVRIGLLAGARGAVDVIQLLQLLLCCVSRCVFSVLLRKQAFVQNVLIFPSTLYFVP